MVYWLSGGQEVETNEQIVNESLAVEYPGLDNQIFQKWRISAAYGDCN